MKAFIKNISYYLPEKVLTNKELVEKFSEWNIEKIVDKIGIEQRHISGDEETAGDMAIKAAEDLFEKNDINPETIDFVLFCTQSPDYFLPTTACIIQNKLGIPTSAGALDFNLGCSGYVYGLSLAKGLIFAGIAKNILLLTAETYTKQIHPLDKGNRSIFGDGAAASIISTEGFAEIGDFVLGTDGSGANNLIIKNGGARFPKNTERNSKDEFVNSPSHLYMNGSEIFKFTLDSVPKLVSNTIEKNKIEKSKVDLFVFHQANKFMLETLRKVCSIDIENFHIDMKDTANTVSSTIPIALSKIQEGNILSKNSTILIAGFGVGYSWGACVLKY